jgi:hypothetical protein
LLRLELVLQYHDNDLQTFEQMIPWLLLLVLQEPEQLDPDPPGPVLGYHVHFYLFYQVLQHQIHYFQRSIENLHGDPLALDLRSVRCP